MKGRLDDEPRAGNIPPGPVDFISRGMAADFRQRNLASRVISMPESACETGQPDLACAAYFENCASSMPDTLASQTMRLWVILKPPWCGLTVTCAVESMESGLKPAWLSISDRAIAKQPAWAAPNSSSGLVPAPSSNREANEYGPLNRPCPKSISPLPSLSVPSQRACAVRVDM